MAPKLQRIFAEAGFRTCFKSANTLRQELVRPKDPTPRDTRTGVVYRIKCESCDQFYVGETGRALNTRVKEHKDAIRLGNYDKSALAAHWYATGHSIDWDPVILDQERHFNSRKIKEAIQIHLLKPPLNRDQGYNVAPALLEVARSRSRLSRHSDQVC